MFDDIGEAFREDVRAAIVASGRPVNLQIDAMRRLLVWLKNSNLEKPSPDEMCEDDEEGTDGELH